MSIEELEDVGQNMKSMNKEFKEVLKIMPIIMVER